MIFKFKNETYNLWATVYTDNNRKALILINDDGENALDITKNVLPSGAKISSDDHIYIKNYSENSGMVVAMKEQGFIEYDITNQYYASFVVINEYKLTQKGIDLWKKEKS